MNEIYSYFEILFKLHLGTKQKSPFLLYKNKAKREVIQKLTTFSSGSLVTAYPLTFRTGPTPR